jgi:hypothetical protein
MGANQSAEAASKEQVISASAQDQSTSVQVRQLPIIS